MKYFSKNQQKYVESLFQGIYKHYGDHLVSLVVFGSYARGEQRFNSDLDILVILDEAYPIKSRFKRVGDFVAFVENQVDDLRAMCEGERIYMEISPFIVTSKEALFFNPLYLDMVQSSLIIEDKNDFFLKILHRTKSSMQKWGSQKKQIGNNWYWEIKKGLTWNEVMDYDQ